MDSPITPAPGHGDAQLDVAGVNTIFGPSLGASNGRMRRAVTPNVTVEGDAGWLHVANAGDGPSREAFTGRLGVMWKSDPSSRSAVMAGVGGGYHDATGPWGAVDVGGVISGHHRWIRPVLAADLGYSGPFEHRTFNVMDGDATTTLRLPRNITTAVSLGVELGPPDMTVFAGVSFAQFWLLESSRVPAGDSSDWGDDLYGMLGLGVRIATD